MPKYVNRVRILGGAWKKTPFVIPTDTDVRPTLVRARVSLFNWLDFFLQSNWRSCVCLDVFAGSGILGFEAASRGAQQVICWEKNTRLVENLHKMKAKLQADQITVLKQDSMVRLKLGGGEYVFDVIFCDPPYDANLYPEVVTLLLPKLKKYGLLYCENSKILDVSAIPGLTLLRQQKIASVYVYLLQKIAS